MAFLNWPYVEGVSAWGEMTSATRWPWYPFIAETEQNTTNGLYLNRFCEIVWFCHHPIIIFEVLMKCRIIISQPISQVSLTPLPISHTVHNPLVPFHYHAGTVIYWWLWTVLTVGVVYLGVRGMSNIKKYPSTNSTSIRLCYMSLLVVGACSTIFHSNVKYFAQICKNHILCLLSNWIYQTSSSRTELWSILFTAHSFILATSSRLKEANETNSHTPNEQ